MIVTVRCLSGLAGVQPEPPEMELPPGASLGDVFARLGLTPDADVVALLDGGPATLRTPLKNGSFIELVPMVEGG